MRKYSRKNNYSTTLDTIDINGLCTSILHNYGLKAISFWIEKHPDSLHSRFSKGFILECIRIILETNNCTFNDEFYRQISGAAICTIFAPIYATLTMKCFEVHFIIFANWEGGEEFQNFFFYNWRRFLEDCQNRLDKNKVKGDQLLETLNSVNDVIKLTMEFSDKKISFLDILTKRDSREHGRICFTNLLIHNNVFHTPQFIQNSA